MKNVLLGSLFAAAALATLPAQAVTVQFGGLNTNVNGGDQSGLTSILATNPNNQYNGQNGLFIETFDNKTGPGGCGLITPPSQINIVGDNYAIRKGTLPNVAATPAGDSTCFAYGPKTGTSAEVRINYSPLLATLGTGASLNYLGLYYGSIDTYNDLDFYDANNNLLRTVTGKEIITQFNGQSGNQTSDRSNIYVNLFFAPSEQFTSFAFRTTGIAFEMDNLAIGFNVRAVPEPGSLALLGLGLGALGLSRRRKGAAKAA